AERARLPFAPAAARRGAPFGAPRGRPRFAGARLFLVDAARRDLLGAPSRAPLFFLALFDVFVLTLSFAAFFNSSGLHASPPRRSVCRLGLAGPVTLARQVADPGRANRERGQSRRARTTFVSAPRTTKVAPRWIQASRPITRAKVP